ncbi:MAG: hypothetical protein DCF16_12180 [Alphaproteobacteria bacterium]|nr:MAG: hypothetical protein DCF16_12180 [Alphaproteobacteria bacterium]
MRIEIIVAADEPAVFFSSVRAAEMALEWIDVRDGVYTALYGRAGECYEIGEDGRDVFIRPTSANDSDALLALLRAFLRAVKVEFAEAEGLEALLSRCERYCIE